MSDLGCTVVGFTVTVVVLSQCGPRTSDGWSALTWMENIMTKTTCNTEVRELSLDELESVTGGVVLQHEQAHASVRFTECQIFDEPGMELWMQCWR
jgi:hypothetical protein